MHSGSAISFVLDVADLYKADYTIPLAFELTARGLVTERDARTALNALEARKAKTSMKEVFEEHREGT